MIDECSNGFFLFQMFTISRAPYRSVGTLKCPLARVSGAFPAWTLAQQRHLFLGQLEEKGRTLSGLAFYPDFASRPFHNFFAMREPDT